MMTEIDIELLKDLRVDYEPYYKETLPLTAMKTYEQERHLAASLIDRQTASLDARDAEIANLESERAHHAMTAGCLRTDLEYANAEIARLREALDDIQMHAVDVGPNVIIPAKQAIARATLEADRD